MREVQFYNITLENVKTGLQRLQKLHIRLDRPEHYFAKMFKSDEQMKRIKNSLVKEQLRIKHFEEKRNRKENKRFAKMV